MTEPKELFVSEHFYSVQGEGPSMGRRAIFLRLSRCNLMCGGNGTAFDKQLHDGATWRCDTIEVWLKGKPHSIAQLTNVFNENGYLAQLEQSAHLIVTGGEPLMQQEALTPFVVFLKAAVGRRFYIEIETNGTVFLTPNLSVEIDQINCSPKLSNSGVPKEKRYREDVLFSLAKDSATNFKFVVSREEDLREIEDDFLGQFPISPRRVWLMPAASNQEQLQKNSILCVDAVKAYGYNFSSRLQVQVWNQTTGV